MCFTVNVNLIKEEIEYRYGINFPDKYRYEPSYYYHAFSFPELAAICSGYSTVRFLKWGLIPSWVRNASEAASVRTKTFNARSESLDSKQSFSSSFKSKRCIIPVRGFYEWQHAGKMKIPWYVYRADGGILSLAGLYSSWYNKDTGEIVDTCSVITTDANEMMAVIHNSRKRMPVVLDRNNEENWISPDSSPSLLSEMLRPCPADVLRAHTIGPLINDRTKVRNTPEIIREYIWDIPHTLF